MTEPTSDPNDPRARDRSTRDPPWAAEFFGTPAAREDADGNADADENENADANANANTDANTDEDADEVREAVQVDTLKKIPERERDDELLAEPPFGDHHLGRLGGFRSGVRQRRRLTIAIALALVGSMFAGYFYIRYLEQYRHYDVFELPPGSELEGRPRVMTWSDGKARFGLHREPPGVHTVELPDRTIHLADGCERAQIRVNIVNGETVELTVITGDVTEVPRD